MQAKLLNHIAGEWAAYAMELRQAVLMSIGNTLMARSLARATHFRRHARSGIVTVNLATAGSDYHVLFGGRGYSSYGSREQGKAAAEFYTTVKTAYISAGLP